MRALYRIGQGFSNLRGSTVPARDALAVQQLGDEELKLFRRMASVDQRHCLAVARSLQASGGPDPSLLKAALLHDVGKSFCSISLVHRTVAVLLTALFGSLPSFLLWQPEGSWWMPFRVLANHPRLGAGMLAGAGTEERVWRLVELHHLAPDTVTGLHDGAWLRQSLEALHRADNDN
ncbi:MAG: hypothetical protein IMZ75_10815 [Actinobacteria bacterium]|nr:hypothetical protein [Actinomycetota bacterium]